MSSLFDPKTRRYTTSPLSSFGTLAGGYRAAIKRKAYFAFHYYDIMRVNNVRNAWMITHLDSPSMRSFQDSSLWESKKLEDPAAIKRLIREGVEYTSAVCVLIGTETWQRRWVKYEIACAVIDERGLVAVHLNSIKHHQALTPHPRGPNPLAYMGVGKVQENFLQPFQYYLFELKPVSRYNGYAWAWVWQWERYQDYTLPVKLPPWLNDPAPGDVTPLSQNAEEYDYVVHDGHKNIGAWIDRAAQRAGR